MEVETCNGTVGFANSGRNLFQLNLNSEKIRDQRLCCNKESAD